MQLEELGVKITIRIQPPQNGQNAGDNQTNKLYRKQSSSFFLVKKRKKLELRWRKGVRIHQLGNWSHTTAIGLLMMWFSLTHEIDPYTMPSTMLVLFFSMKLVSFAMDSNFILYVCFSPTLLKVTLAAAKGHGWACSCSPMFLGSKNINRAPLAACKISAMSNSWPWIKEHTTIFPSKSYEGIYAGNHRIKRQLEERHLLQYYWMQEREEPVKTYPFPSTTSMWNEWSIDPAPWGCVHHRKSRWTTISGITFHKDATLHGSKPSFCNDVDIVWSFRSIR